MVNLEKIFLLKNLLDMNYNLIAQVILFCSTVALGQMIFRKMPILSSLSEVAETKEEEKLLTKIKGEITILIGSGEAHRH